MDKYDYFDSTLGDFLGMENEYELLSKKAKVSHFSSILDNKIASIGINNKGTPHCFEKIGGV